VPRRQFYIACMEECKESVEQFAWAWKEMVWECPHTEISDSPEGVSIRWAEHLFTFWNSIFLTKPIVSSAELKERVNEATSVMHRKKIKGYIFICEEYLGEEPKHELPSIVTSASLEFAVMIAGMAGDVRDFPPRPHPTLSIRRVTDDVMKRDFCAINCEAYGYPPEAVEGMVSSRYVANEFVFLGFENERPVVAAAVVVTPVCLLANLVATRMEARRKGYAAATLRHALQVAYEATGMSRTVLHATEDGLPVYKKMGYHTTCKFLLYTTKK